MKRLFRYFFKKKEQPQSIYETLITPKQRTGLIRRVHGFKI